MTFAVSRAPELRLDNPLGVGFRVEPLTSSPPKAYGLMVSSQLNDALSKSGLGCSRSTCAVRDQEIETVFTFVESHRHLKNQRQRKLGIGGCAFIIRRAVENHFVHGAETEKQILSAFVIKSDAYADR